MANTLWTREQIHQLRLLKDEGRTYEEISKILQKSPDSVRKKIKRTDWELFSNDPEYSNTSHRKWNPTEMIQLDAFLRSQKSYLFIAKAMNRSEESIAHKAQKTDWKAWKTLNIDEKEKKTEENDRSGLNLANNQHVERVIDSLFKLCRQEIGRLQDITEEEFLRKINAEKTILTIPFEEIKRLTLNKMEELGFSNPDHLDLQEGTYLIVGDSHGKFTRSKMFEFLKSFIDFLNPKNVIHVGHIMDDDNDISYCWGEIKNLTILAKKEELHLVQSQRNKYNFTYNIVKGDIKIGNELTVTNQDLISDYVKTPIRLLDSEIFNPQVVVNCHRMETMSKCSDDIKQYFASPGCLCEQHIVKTIKQLDFHNDNKVVKEAFYGGFSKYRKMEHMNKYWTQGCIVVHVDSHGQHTIIPCSIQKVGDDYATSYFNKIISSTGVHEPQKRIFVTGDMHSPSHDANILDIQEQICRDYKADVLVNLGDAHDYRALNHHDMEKENVIFGDVLQECAQTNHILRRMRKWAKDCHIIYGNHERFSKDFIDRYPQFASILDFSFMCGIKKLNYKMTNLKEVLRIGSAKFIHGDIIMYGQSGNKAEKASRTFGHDIFIGHVHYPSIRFGSYTVGLSGLLDQRYNEPEASTWIHGFGFCNQYLGKNWMTSIAIMDNKCILNGKTYEPKNPDVWNMKNCEISIDYITS